MTRKTSDACAFISMNVCKCGALLCAAQWHYFFFKRGGCVLTRGERGPEVPSGSSDASACDCSMYDSILHMARAAGKS